MDTSILPKGSFPIKMNINELLPDGDMVLRIPEDRKTMIRSIVTTDDIKANNGLMEEG
jgi:hypothetical protein